MIIDTCPHCETKHVQTSARFSDNLDARTAARQWGLYRCQNKDCGKLILIQTKQSGEIELVYPPTGTGLESTAPVSQEIRDDFREAALSLGVGCYKASLVMSRRVLQRCLKEQGATQHNLVDAIEHSVKAAILRKSFHPIADEIRHYGNLSAHPDDDQLQNANRESAETVLEFCRLLIHEFYEVPAAAALLKRNRTT
jgi:hypothetical protein